ncbi:uncharacterized protein B0H18DRAFT_1002574 [Fomitopsis serialis]|uniref:uncharacterized protein n=1 Tax=Fomitopsis serialis TaxID=139415 RepID=UPI00200868BD|nr:uncharacterized protein B0H18DRAFT_1002574 [Neoantrodia serialis]KAH9927579.1 hypothetical protein B0H18DRAFT_1002574 [Neoantrodia serialis]
MRTYLVVGASRGIGLALVQELLKDPTTHVLATARSLPRSPGLYALTSSYPPTRLSILELDVADPASVERGAANAAALLSEHEGLDCLIHSAAMSLQELVPFEQVDIAAFHQELYTNTVAPLHVARSFLPLLRHGLSASDAETAKKVVFVSSSLGSLELAPQSIGLSETYSVTKAGLGMIARKWGAMLKEEGICTMVLHPGWVDTDLGNTVNAWFSEHLPALQKIRPADCAAQCLQVIRDARLEDAVAFYSHDGSRLPW